MSSKKILPFILIITFLAYAQSLWYGFVFDDHSFIVKNPTITSLNYVQGYFTGSVWKHLSSSDSYYRPFLSLWMLINYLLFSLNSALWHLSSVLLHVFNTFLVYKCARKLNVDTKVASGSCALFALHPVHIESVVWITGVADSLLSTFLLSSFLLFPFKQTTSSLEALNESTNKLAPDKYVLLKYVGSICLYVAALLTKETAVIFPVLLFAYTLLVSQESLKFKNWLVSLKRCAAFLAVTVGYLFLRVGILEGIATKSALDLSTLILSAPYALCKHLLLLLLPVNLSLFYDNTYVTALNVNFFVPIICLALIGVGTILAKSRKVLFLSLWIILPLAPLLNVSLLLYKDFVHDRYVYFSSAGFCILLAILINKFSSKLRITFYTIILLTYTCLTVVQTQVWKNDLSLYFHSAQNSPQSLIANYNLATELTRVGQLPAALSVYDHLLSIHTTFFPALYNTGHLYYQLNDCEKADSYLTKSITVNPNHPDSYLFRGLCRIKQTETKGSSSVNNEQIEMAVSDFATAVKLSPDVADYHLALGVGLRKKGDLDLALKAFEEALRLDPTNPDTALQIEVVSEMKRHP